MQRYEYRAVPAPKKGKKAKGVRGAEARFANALTACMNEMAADGWEYLRTDTLPSEERTGITGRTTVFQNMLVFRREVEEGAVLAPSTLGAQVEAASEDNYPRLPSATEAQDFAEIEETTAIDGTPAFTEDAAEIAAEPDRVDAEAEPDEEPLAAEAEQPDADASEDDADTIEEAAPETDDTSDKDGDDPDDKKPTAAA